MKLAIINVSLRPESHRRQLPVGLAFVLTALKRAGIDFDLIDMDIEHMGMAELEDILLRERYDALGLGCIVTGLRMVRDIAALAKRINPQAVVFAGNSVATSIPDLLLRNTSVDIAVMGEGDVTVVELVRALESGSDLGQVAGLAFLRAGQVQRTPARPLIKHLDEVGYPDWTVFDLEKYNQYALVNVNQLSQEKTRSFPLSTARGCPYNCTFCYHVFKGQHYRRYSDACIAREIVRLHDDLGAGFMSLWDELSFPTVKSIESFLDALETLGFPVGWEAPCRAGLLRREHLSLVRRMKTLGCDSISFSLENAEPEILAAMNKRISVDDFVEQAMVFQEGGVIPLTSVIFGFPQETEASIVKTIEVCERCNIFPSVGFLLPLPGTPIYDWAVEKGLISDELEYLLRIGDRQDFHINLTQLSDEKLVGLVSDGLRGLAERQGLHLDSVFKTGTYQSPLAKSQTTPPEAE